MGKSGTSTDAVVAWRDCAASQHCGRVATVGDIAIYICRDPVDFRMGINGLSVFVEATLKYNPFSRSLFCFVNKRKCQIKVSTGSARASACG